MTIGKQRIRALKYADDIAIMAETAGQLEKMILTLERDIDKAELTVNVEKTKIMVFRNGGKRKKGERWRYKNK